MYSAPEAGSIEHRNRSERFTITLMISATPQWTELNGHINGIKDNENAHQGLSCQRWFFTQPSGCSHSSVSFLEARRGRTHCQTSMKLPYQSFKMECRTETSKVWTLFTSVYFWPGICVGKSLTTCFEGLFRKDRRGEFERTATTSGPGNQS